MLGISMIHGLSVGIEYFDDEQAGFGVNLDLGIFRFTWFRDLIEDDMQ
jgi:hypothetical protein